MRNLLRNYFLTRNEGFKIRLDRYLSELGAGSRKEIKAFIKQGYVKVEGTERVTSDMRIDENTAVVYFNGERLEYRKFAYLMMNKPAGVVSATYDSGGEKTVIDLLPEAYAYLGLFPVGRLDKDTTGLLLLTNDGAFAHRMTSPKKNIKKTYYAVVTGTVSEGDILAFSRGVKLSDFTALPATLSLIDETTDAELVKICRKDISGKIKPPDCSEVLVVISEGKFHQIKRMFEALGKSVICLKRVKHGDYVLPLELEEGGVAEIEP